MCKHETYSCLLVLVLFGLYIVIVRSTFVLSTNQKIKKSIRKISTNSLLKKMVFERFDKHLPFFKFKYDFNAFCYSKFPDFENLYTILTINKGSSVVRTSSSSQASQNESVVCDFVKPDEGENWTISSTENAPDIEEKDDNGNFNNIPTLRGERLEGKFVSSNVINLSRRNLSVAEISLRVSSFFLQPLK